MPGIQGCNEGAHIREQYREAEKNHSTRNRADKEHARTGQCRHIEQGTHNKAGHRGLQKKDKERTQKYIQVC